MKLWQIKLNMVEEIDCEKSDSNNANIFNTKEKAIKTAINRVEVKLKRNYYYLKTVRECRKSIGYRGLLCY